MAGVTTAYRVYGMAGVLAAVIDAGAAARTRRASAITARGPRVERED